MEQTRKMWALADVAHCPRGGFRTICLGSVAVLLLLSIAACGHGGTTTDHTTTDSSSEEVNISTTPATEESTTEAPRSGGGGGGSIPIASLPVGGAQTGDFSDAAPAQCVGVGWNDNSLEIPDGVEIEVTGVSFDPADVFQVGDASICSGEQVCTDEGFRIDSNSRACSIPFEQISNSSGDVTVTVEASATCPDQSICDRFQRELSNASTSISLSPGTLGTASSESTTSDATGSSSPESTAFESTRVTDEASSETTGG
jgi:hypothetical protein